MPATGVTRDIAFASAPQAAENDEVAVHLPATFDPKAPLVLCLFFHGKGGEVPFEDHIQKAIDQIATCPVNAALVAPRFGDDCDPGTFEDARGFADFIAELQTTLPATADAPIVLTAFSGGWKPLKAVLNGLLARPSGLADRIKGILLLDSIYGPISSAGVIAWQQARRAQTTLLSIYGRDTGDDAKVSNLALIETLKAMGSVLAPAAWTDLKAFLPGSVVFFEVTTPHLDIVRDGPPAGPIAAFLGLLTPDVRPPAPKPTSDARIA